MGELKYQQENQNPKERKEFIRDIFDDIVPTYDLLNRLLSAGIDRRWRRYLVSSSGDLKGKAVLDLCCGTGDLSRQLRGAGAEVYSLDFCFPMLEKGREKKWLDNLSVAADASKLPWRDSSFAMLTIAFGIRNIPDLQNLMNEACRVLEAGGRFRILELTRPASPLVGIFYKFYLSFFLPRVGGLISGRKQAYRYLSSTIATFLDPELLSSMLKEAGFGKVEVRKMTFGIASIITAVKPSASGDIA